MTILEIKLRIVEWVMRGCDFQMVAHRCGRDKHIAGAIYYYPTEEARKHIARIVAVACENEEWFKEVYLAGAEAYLSRYEIDAKNFIEKIQNNSNSPKSGE